MTKSKPYNGDLHVLLNCLPMNTIRQIEGDLMFNILNPNEVKIVKKMSKSFLDDITPLIPRHKKPAKTD